ncbi:MAG: OB-fold nucleic acid binding domain-containing protein [Haloferacaceae archaeon]
MDWITHEEDVWFDFRGDDPQQLKPNRFYRGTVDGYADFGVFVDLSPGVTGLLHRSELDRRLESLDWEPGDTVFVQVKNVRENGNIDLAWSKRQREDEFRGARIHNPGAENDGEPVDEPAEEEDETVSVSKRPTPTFDEEAEEPGREKTEKQSREAEESGREQAEESEPAAESSESDAEATSEETGTTDERDGSEPTGERERVPIGDLGDHVGDQVRIEAEILTARQTGGPTVFELRDESGVVDAAAFVEAGVRAYPEIGEGDVVRLDGEVEVRRDELQVETEALEALSGEQREAVERRMADALTSKARPEAIKPLADHEAVRAITEQLADAAEAVRRAVLETRPIVVRHAATADGYIAGAAVERAVLPLIREEHAKADAEYHFFDRRPLDDAVYGMDAATNDATRMLQSAERHGEKLPLVLLVGTGSTDASADGLGLLATYGAPRVVVDAAAADPEIEAEVDTLVNPGIAGVEAGDLSTSALAANLAAAVNDDARDDLAHLPAASYWEEAPQAYVDLATEAGYDADDLRELREAIALEAYYQSYEGKRELVTDLLFEEETVAAEAESIRDLASHVSEQFRKKLEAEIETATANVQIEEAGGVRFAILDADAYTHRFDFPPTTLLLDELHRRERGDGPFVTLALGMDELYLRSTADLDVRDVADVARQTVSDAGITAYGVREGRIEFLSGRRDAVEDAVIAAVAEHLG